MPTGAQLAAAGPLDAVRIAGAARSMAPAEMRQALAPVARFFAACGAPVLLYKCCSTFDSAPAIGSIGAAVMTLAAALGDRPALIVGGQPSLGRYCAFGQLFASAREKGIVHRIDRHPTMSRHPVTPMTEADLRLHLAGQGLAPIASLDLTHYEQAGPDVESTLQAMLAPRGNDAARAVLMDVVSDSQLAIIGRLLWQRAQAAPQLCVGASSVAQALLRHWGVASLEQPGAIAPAKGPVLVLSGSMSALSVRQIHAAQSFERLPLDAVKLAGGDGGYEQAMAARICALLRGGRHVLAHTQPSAAGPGESRIAASRGLALACGRLLRQVLERTSVARLCIAGGDTSSLGLQALAPTAMEWLGRPSAGIALCRLHAAPTWLDGMEVVLKGGQMGSDDLFERLIGEA